MMMKKVFFLIATLYVYTLQAQVGIGTTTPQGALDIVSTNDTGVVIPRVSSIANVTDGQGNPPANGTVVYDISKNSICFYLNQNWACVEFGSHGTVGLGINNFFYQSQDTYIKASNTETNDRFGRVIALSADGNTLVVGTRNEDSNATGVNGNQADNSAGSSGAVYVFFKNTGVWSQQAYIKSSNSEGGDGFGVSVDISNDGNTLAVGAYLEDSNTTGINGNQADNSAANSGATYVFSRSGATWSQQAYIKASNTEATDRFGENLGISGDGNTLAVGATNEDSNATGINGNQADNSASSSGAAYVFIRSGTTWSQQAYIKASNTDTFDVFGENLSLSGNGNTLAIGASSEASSAAGINGNQADNSTSFSGAAYVFSRSGTTWSQQAYIKASNTEANDRFGQNLSLSGDGNTLAISAISEDSNATGIDGNQADNSAGSSGAVYAFSRSGTTWSQQAYIKASNTDIGDVFGTNLSISDDGNALAIGAPQEDSNATGVDGDQTDNATVNSGAGYVFIRSGAIWSQRAYIKASNTEGGDQFGTGISLSSDGAILAVSALEEDSNATGINGDQTNNFSSRSGAVYMYEN